MSNKPMGLHGLLQVYSSNEFKCIWRHTISGGSLVTTAWHELGSRMEETPSSNGGVAANISNKQ
jgi:hypothetical protein